MRLPRHFAPRNDNNKLGCCVNVKVVTILSDPDEIGRVEGSPNLQSKCRGSFDFVSLRSGWFLISNDEARSLKTLQLQHFEASSFELRYFYSFLYLSNSSLTSSYPFFPNTPYIAFFESSTPGWSNVFIFKRFPK